MKTKLVKPIKPNPPKEPVAPQRVKTVIHSMQVTLSGMTLAGLIEHLAGIDKDWDPSRRALPVDLSTVQFGTDVDYGDSGSYPVARWDQAIEITLTEAEYAAALAKHEKDLLRYRLKLAEYETLSKRYEADIVAYEAKVAEGQRDHELALLTKLAEKHGKRVS